MVYFAENTISLPHFAGDGNGTGELTYGYYKLPAWEDNLNLAGDFQGYGLTTVILAYLTQCWIELKRPLQGFNYTLHIEGSGYTSSRASFLEPRLTAAGLNLVEDPPQNTNEVFGKEPLMYLGCCGFGAVTFTDFAQATGFGQFFPTKSGARTILDTITYINHRNSRVVPPTNIISNLFWWHLKPGVHGTVTLTDENLFQGIGSNYIDAGHQIQAFNPMQFNPWAAGTRDGEGNNP